MYKVRSCIFEGLLSQRFAHTPTPKSNSVTAFIGTPLGTLPPRLDSPRRSRSTSSSCAGTPENVGHQSVPARHGNERICRAEALQRPTLVNVLTGVSAPQSLGTAKAEGQGFEPWIQV